MNSGYANADLNNGSTHIKDYLPALSDDRADWQRVWEDELGKVWYRTSLLGSTLFAVDSDGEVISHVIYDPWGNPLTERGRQTVIKPASLPRIMI